MDEHLTFVHFGDILAFGVEAQCCHLVAVKFECCLFGQSVKFYTYGVDLSIFRVGV